MTSSKTRRNPWIYSRNCIHYYVCIRYSINNTATKIGKKIGQIDSGLRTGTSYIENLAGVMRCIETYGCKQLVRGCLQLAADSRRNLWSAGDVSVPARQRWAERNELFAIMTLLQHVFQRWFNCICFYLFCNICL